MTVPVVSDPTTAVEDVNRDRLARAQRERERALINQFSSLMDIVSTFISAASVTVSAAQLSKDVNDDVRRELIGEASESLRRAQGWLLQISELLRPNEPPF